MNPKDLIEYDGPDRIVHFTEYLKLKEEENRGIKSFNSTFPQFDQKLEGLQTGELTVVSGKTGEGKTLLAESWMRGLMKNSPDLKACFFSYEVQPKSLLQKYSDNPQAPLYLPLTLQTSDFTWLSERVWEAAVKQNCRLFVFDHLHFLIDMAERHNMSLNIGKFMRELKQKIAVGLNVSVILIAHQKGVPKGEDPSLEDVRDSTFITQEADNVIIVWRRPNFTMQEMDKMYQENPDAAYKIQMLRGGGLSGMNPDPYSEKFAIVQIAKARRSGTFRWKKLFHKHGPFLEEV